ncbi:hypothetical protein H7F51_06460 [Novosphingobium flavum]|uniref:Glycosyltransferase RgtA/B/C/D-like domain-containing protein n=1 Tax=Novosphingobium flavum TaxID=1778672 RepID=A0A7X1FQX0_9SPHN|nr:hypothetical protein [Novosphingobium flavum]MBC2665154.1 hypothetical protein [Novosphingobium flavum]
MDIERSLTFPARPAPARHRAPLGALRSAGQAMTLLLAAACAITALHALSSLALPFGWDQGIMASVGSSYVHGGLPYADSWDMKGPAAYLPYTLAEFLFGRTMWGVRILDVVIVGLGAFCLGQSVRALTNALIGTSAAFAFYYWIAAGGWFFTAAPESWAAAACVLAIAPLLTAPSAPTHRQLALSGLLIGGVGLIKPVYLAVGIAPLLAIALAPGISLRRRAALALTLGLGSALPVIGAGLYFASKGGLARAIEVHILYPVSTYSHLPTGTSLTEGIATFLARPVVALLCPFIALGVWSWRRQPQILWPVLGWIAAMVLAVILQGKYYYYQWVPCYAPLLLLAAGGIHTLLQDGPQADGARAGAGRFIAAAAAITLAAQVCAMPLRDTAKFLYYFALERAPDRYYASFHFAPDNASGARIYEVAAEREAARYIAAHTGPADPVFVWGNDATVQYLADRPNPTRFSFEMPLSLDGEYRAAYRAEAMAAFHRAPPVYFVAGMNWWAADTKAQSLARFPELAAFVKAHYHLEKSIGTLDLYRLDQTGLAHLRKTMNLEAR